MRALRSIATAVAFAVIVVGALGYIAALGVRTGPPAARTELSMVVTNLNGLVTGSRVLLRGVPVGAVTAVHPTVEGVTVDFYVDAAHPIPADTVVRLDNLSALGRP